MTPEEEIELYAAALEHVFGHDRHDEATALRDWMDERGVRLVHAPGPDRTCESCGAPADVLLDDDSTWCFDCDAAARRLGYDSPDPMVDVPTGGRL